MTAFSDRLAMIQDKMREYLASGARLGWLLNPDDQQAEIYRPGQAVEVLQAPATLSGKSVLPDFVLNLEWLWM